MTVIEQLYDCYITVIWQLYNCQNLTVIYVSKWADKIQMRVIKLLSVNSIHPYKLYNSSYKKIRVNLSRVNFVER